MTTPTAAAIALPHTDLHPSLHDPLLDSMNFLNEIANRYPDAISFAPGRPYQEPFDAEVVAGHLRTFERHLRAELGLTAEQAGSLLFQYGRTKGQINDLVARTVHNDEGIEAPPEAVVVTVGAQEGMLLVLRALIRDQPDALLVASPCYLGMTGAARILDVPVEPVAEGDAGVEPEAVRAAVRRLRSAGRRPRLLYLTPDFANPSGARMPLPARERLLQLAAEEDFLLLEDNPYGLFSRDEQDLPVLKRLDQQHRVIYLGTFAKTCFPGARVGYVIADQPVAAADGTHHLLADELAKLKSMTTVNTSPVAQAVIGGMLLAHGCRLRTANRERIATYRRRMQLLEDALATHFPAGTRERLGVSWNSPDGGFFLVLNVPFVADEQALTRSAREHGVLWTPMSFFHVDHGGQHQLRLSASYLAVDQIDEGVRRLRDLVTASAAPGTP